MPPARGSRSARRRSISCPAAAKPTGWPALTAALFSCARLTAAWSWRRTRRRSSTASRGAGAGGGIAVANGRRRSGLDRRCAAPAAVRLRARRGAASRPRAGVRRQPPRPRARPEWPGAHPFMRGDRSIITDALQHLGSRIADSDPSPSVLRGSHRARPKRERLIRSGCARLPPVARTYRDLTDADGELRSGTTVSEREARVTTQVLHVVMRDPDPGR